MPAPLLYHQNTSEVFNLTYPFTGADLPELFYATNREPSPDPSEMYGVKRGGVLHLGTAEIMMGKGDFSWEEARRISLLKNRTDKYPLKVRSVNEIGILGLSLTPFYADKILEKGAVVKDVQFASRINRQLAQSRGKDIYIYVPGYKVNFDNPILVASELWHFLGYKGVFVAFSWPATPKTLAYLSDLETAELSSYYLRIFIEYLAKSTKAERIHVLGYSAGTQVVEKAMFQLTLAYKHAPKDSIKNLRLGHIMLVGSDLDAEIFGANLQEGMLDVADDMTVYMSGTDTALGLSSWIFNRARLGQAPKDMAESVKTYLEDNPKLRLIDVTKASSANTGNGHAYFRQSPWVSSDILMTLMYNASPKERGLVMEEGWPVWTFPADYMERLKEDLTRRLSKSTSDGALAKTPRNAE
ncbi:alpha/beta hydrolase [Maridesulfovibrio ferrireducens]|nr:alpha/beta hydrolase [Maridesulfovibrio ferrireducens]